MLVIKIFYKYCRHFELDDSLMKIEGISGEGSEEREDFGSDFIFEINKIWMG